MLGAALDRQIDLYRAALPSGDCSDCAEAGDLAGDRVGALPDPADHLSVIRDGPLRAQDSGLLVIELHLEELLLLVVIAQNLKDRQTAVVLVFLLEIVAVENPLRG